MDQTRHIIRRMLIEAEMPGLDQDTQEQIVAALNKVAGELAPELETNEELVAPVMLVNLENPFGDPIPTMFFLVLKRGISTVNPFVRGGSAFWKGMGAEVDKHIPKEAQHPDAEAYVQLAITADAYASEEDFEIANEDRYEDVMRVLDHESSHIQRGHDPRMDWEKAQVDYDPTGALPSVRKRSKFRRYAGHPIETDADISAVIQYAKRLGQEQVSKKYLDRELQVLGASHLLARQDVRRKLISRLAKAGFRFKRTWEISRLPTMPGQTPLPPRPV